MNKNELVKQVQRTFKTNSPTIYSGVAGVGTVLTAYLVGRASFKAARVIDKADQDGEFDYTMSKTNLIIAKTKLVWKLYVPSAITGTTTIVSIVAANKVSANKTAAAQAALSVANQIHTEYRDRVIEEYGPNKDQSIRDSITEKRIKELPPSSDILVTGPGNSLFREDFTGRYFACDMETMRKAQNDINHKLLSQDYATMDDLYYMIGLGGTSGSSQIGWRSDKLMNMNFTAVMTDDGRACISFEYNYTIPL